MSALVSFKLAFSWSDSIIQIPTFLFPLYSSRTGLSIVKRKIEAEAVTENRGRPQGGWYGGGSPPAPRRAEPLPPDPRAVPAITLDAFHSDHFAGIFLRKLY